MKHSLIETALGAVVIAAALVFLVFSYSVADVSDVDGYELRADFTATGGLKPGDDVEISGVKVGSVERVALDDETYRAQVFFTIKPHVQVPEDTAAVISSVSLLGGRYLALEPGGSDVMLKPGSVVEMTQAPQNLEQLLGKFIFSATSKDGADGAADAAPAPAAEAPAPGAAPDISPEAGGLTPDEQPLPDATVPSAAPTGTL